jgi:WD40 repeat protein
MSQPDTENLFVGPRPIVEKDRFFGRDNEIKHLTHLVLAERIVLAYSPSGAGKSSLIEAGVLSEFKSVTRGEFEVLPTVRLSLNVNQAKSDSPFSEAAVRCWISPEEALKDPSRLGSIASFVKHFRETQEQERKGKELCVLLVFDQFEECLTLLPSAKGAVTALFNDLSLVLRDENVWALFAIREDLLGPIIDLGQSLPTGFRQTFRLDFLHLQNAMEVIEKTLVKGKYEFEQALIEELTNDLALVNVQDLNGKFHWEPGEYVEPLILQVVCKYILQQLPAGTSKINRNHLRVVPAEKISDETPFRERLADRILPAADRRKERVSRVDAALAAYYRGELSRISRGDKQREKELRFWIEEKLVDLNRTRIPVRQEKEETEGLKNTQLDELYTAYVVRKERRLNAFWYELAHDRLVLPVLLDNAAWFKETLGLVTQRYQRWLRSGKLPRYLLNLGELWSVWKERKEGSFARQEVQFIQQSQKSFVRTILVFGTALIIPLLVGAGVAWVIAQIQMYNERVAHLRQFSALRPLFSQWSPVTMDQNALFISELTKELREKGKSTDPMLVGNLFSILDSMLVWRSRVAETQWNFQLSTSKKFAGNVWSVLSVASSQDGEIVMGDTHGQIRFLRDHVLSNPIVISQQSGQIETLAYSVDGSRLAVGTENDFIWLFDTRGADSERRKVRLSTDSKDKLPMVQSCSWNKQGDLAAGCDDGKVYIWPHLLSALDTANVQTCIVVENRPRDALVPVVAVAWDPAGKMLAIGDSTGDVRLWNGDTVCDAQDRNTEHHEGVSAVAWSDDGRLACASLDHSISIWKIDDAGSSTVLSRTRLWEHAHDQWVRDLTWIGPNMIASVGDDSALRFWKDSESKETSREFTPASKINKMSYNAALKMIVTADNDGAVRLYNVSPRTTQKYGYHESAVISLTAVESHVLSFDSQGVSGDFDVIANKEETKPEENAAIHSVQFVPSLKVFVVAASVSDTQGRISVFRPPNLIAECDYSEPVTIVACHPTQPIVAFVTNRGTLGLRRLPDLKPISSQQDAKFFSAAEFRAVRGAWSNDGTDLAIALNSKADRRSEINVLRYADEKVADIRRPGRIQFTNVQINQMAWHPSEAMIAIGTADGEIILQPIAEKNANFKLVSHVGRVTALAWFSSGDRLVSAGEDRSIKVWKYEKSTGLTLVTALPSDGSVYAIAIAPHESGFYAAGGSPQISYFPEDRYSRDEILAKIKRIVNRNMLPAEWERFSLSDEFGGGHYDPTFPDLISLSDQVP